MEDFKQLNPQEWKLKVQAELAGLDYNEVLVWDTAEGIQIKPVYTQEDLLQTVFPIQTTKDWKIIGQFLPDANQDTSYLYGLKIKDQQIDKLKSLPEYLDLFFDLEKPFEVLSKNNFASFKNLKYLGLDVLGHFAESGDWYRSEEEDLALAEKLIDEGNFAKSVEVNASLFQNAGANHVLQIALAISQAVEYLETLGEKVAPKLYFKVAVGGNYFFEIAKLRALRNLWELILAEYNSDAEVYILAETSLRNKSVLDVYNNVIRSGLEAAAAVQGKADVVYAFPYDSIGKSSDFSEELASKQQLLLQKESYFDKVMDPISGTYFIENLTELMSRNALDLFKKLEEEGGFLKGLFEGRIQKMIQKSADREQMAFDEGEMILIGVNKFRNPSDQPKPVEKPSLPIMTQIQPIIRKRLAEKIESDL
ncbi:methylmalonyl-CoA mutase family protein [Moheibacter lacus]|uniref:Methylmalonyl-CoA mutase n=1 Tax=Moheibacter lacus TaxID=2745851 RepID=A0A838ZL74_9FLAO|nr:methylmalonyl-CoA mutase family protein [Moheibacter lacus]MBA5628256.1 methylmalonyl-CoA mutase [Moheibacter lacus]